MIAKSKPLPRVITGLHPKQTRHPSKLLAGGDEFVCKYSFKTLTNP